MKHFECDYACGGHPQVLAKLMAINGEENTGYGVDPHWPCYGDSQGLCRPRLCPVRSCL